MTLIQYNAWHSWPCSVVERTVGLQKGKWLCLHATGLLHFQGRANNGRVLLPPWGAETWSTAWAQTSVPANSRRYSTLSVREDCADKWRRYDNCDWLHGLLNSALLEAISSRAFVSTVSTMAMASTLLRLCKRHLAEATTVRARLFNKEKS